MSSPPKTSVREVLEAIAPAAQRDNPKAARIREALAMHDATTMEPAKVVALAAKAVDGMKDLLRADKMIVICSGMDEMAKHLAEDEDTSPEAARLKLDTNAARAFTAEKTGVIYFVQCDETPHDMVHETVHVTSAPGGTTRIKKEFGDPLNEGFTEMFTKQFCAELGVADAPAYPGEVAFVKKLEAAVSYAAVFQAYMKNAGMAEILKTLSARWASRSEAFGKAFSTKKHVPPAEPEQRLALLVERLKDGLFLTTHKPFWDALLKPG